jgi:putative methyltransferase (TIGR04325 family)
MLTTLIQHTKNTLKRPLRWIGYSSSMWSGDYASMADALQHCEGYDADVIVNKCKTALLEVQAGRALYERDSILFHEPRYDWELLSIVQQIAWKKQGRVEVLDFGGALGSIYFQHRQWFQQYPELHWSVIDQPKLMDVGKQYAENEHLKFHHSLEDYLSAHKPDLLLLSGVLQYLDDPHDWIQKIQSWNIPYVLVLRTAFIHDTNRDVLTVQNVWPHIYKASYPSWFFDKKGFLTSFSAYREVANFLSISDPPNWVNGHKSEWQGFLFEKKGLNTLHAKTSDI